MRAAGLFAVAALLLSACGTHKTTSERAQAGLYLSPSSQSDERAAKVLPMKGSENVRYLLTYQAPIEAATTTDSATQYFANERFDWIIELRPPQAVTRQQLQACFSQPWQEAHGEPTLYGRSVRSGRWTYATAAGADSVFSGLALGWKLYNARTDSPKPLTAAELAAFEQATLAQASGLPAQLVRLNYLPPQAAVISKQLSQFVVANDQAATIVLKAGTAFKGPAIWDAMQSLGLRWGDMDLFHWDNPAPATGDDSLFDVYTSTEPGYFLPERIAAGEVNTNDLIFSFSIPRSAAPEQVLASMYKAASYCQRKLGGQLLDDSGKPFDLVKEQRKCQAVAAELQTKQLRTGMADALYLF